MDSAVLSGLIVEVLYVGEVASSGRGFSMLSSLSSKPEKISRASGAGFSSDKYSGIGGTEVILFVSTLTSMLACTIDILTLKGAISYARLCFVSVEAVGTVIHTHVTVTFNSPLRGAIHAKSRCSKMTS